MNRKLLILAPLALAMSVNARVAKDAIATSTPDAAP